ncbi:MAG: hypothetical protein ABIO83_00650 [Ilumatobacteraceae bacterium]
MNDIKNFDIRNLDIRNLELPQLDLTGLDLSRLDVRNVDLPSIDLDRVMGFARDTAYVGIGALVVTAQKTAERRRAITDDVTAQVRRLVDVVS